MRLTVVYDNEVFKKGAGLAADWGFACLVETKNDTVLFDTGAKGEILLSNMQRLGINPKDINKIVISHEHWDHNGGLESLVTLVDEVEVYRIEKNDMKGNIKQVTVKEMQMISQGVYSTGRLEGSPVDEQSLILNGNNGWYVLAGCSHPGVEKILHKARHLGDIVGVLGGFHGFNNFSILKDLKYVCPCHCTKYKNEINASFPLISSKCGAGKSITLDEGT